MKRYIYLYIFSKLLVIFTIINQIIQRQNKLSIFACIVLFILLDIFKIIKNKTNDSIINAVINTLTIFIVILSLIQNFIDIFKGWDTVMHTTTGFVAASLFIYVFRKIKINYKFLLLTAFCFSMTVGVVWEILEFGLDYILLKDSQKDRIVTSFKTNLLEKDKDTTIKDIKYTIIYSGNNNNLKETKIEGYIDIGIIDTMKDLNVNLLGAISALIICSPILKKNLK